MSTAFSCLFCHEPFSALVCRKPENWGSFGLLEPGESMRFFGLKFQVKNRTELCRKFGRRAQYIIHSQTATGSSGSAQPQLPGPP